MDGYATSAEEYTVVMNRFKLLNLVQRVAHNDVMEMVDAMGLDALTHHHGATKYKNMFDDGHRQNPLGGALGKDKLSSGAGRRYPSRRTNTDVRAEAARRNANFPAPADGGRQRRRQAPGHASAADTYNRLAAPRRQHYRESEQHLVRSPHQSAAGAPPWRQLEPYRQPSPTTWPPSPSQTQRGHEGPHPQHGLEEEQGTLDRGFPSFTPSDSMVGHADRGAAAENPQLTRTSPHLQFTSELGSPVDGDTGKLSDGGTGGTGTVSAGLPRLTLPTYPGGSQATAPSPTSSSYSPITGEGVLGSSSSGVRRGALGAKAKPKAALDSPRVPMDVIRHAAAMISNASPQGQEFHSLPAQHDHQSLLVNRGAASYSAGAQPTRGAAAGADWSVHGNRRPPLDASQAQGSPEQGSPVPFAAAGKESLEELSRAIDGMLQDHQIILQEVLRGEEGGDAHSEAAARHQRGREQKALSDAEEAADAIDRADVIDVEDVDDEADEMLLYARLQQKIDQMDASVHGIMRSQQYQHQQEQDEQAEEDEASPATPPRPVAAAATQPKRVRGRVPSPIVRRLRSYQMECHEYTAYNEKLWNTSHLSQYAFAQRLTNTLFEDCLEEVVAEVGTIMDDYVEGLAEHELQ